MSSFQEEPSPATAQGDEDEGEMSLSTQWRGLEVAGGCEDDPEEQMASTPEALGHEDQPLHLIQYMMQHSDSINETRHVNADGDTTTTALVSSSGKVTSSQHLC